MKIVFKNSFEDHILANGSFYNYSGHVVKIDREGNNIRAIVSGSEDYQVSITIKDNQFIDGNCTCPYYKSGNYCKHMAAVLFNVNNESYYDDEDDDDDYIYEDCIEEDDLNNAISQIDEDSIRQFLYNSLISNKDLYDRFRLRFNDYFSSLSKEDYQEKINDAIYSCYDRHGFIDYNNTSNYSYEMNKFIEEATILVEKGKFSLAFDICTLLLDSIPNTAIDDSDGSTGMLANSCINIIHNILSLSNDKALLKDILSYLIDEVKTANLYNYGIDLSSLLEYYIDNKLFLEDIEVLLEESLNDSKDKNYFYERKTYIEYLISIYKYFNKDSKILELLKKYSSDNRVLLMYVDRLILENNLKEAILILNTKIVNERYNRDFYDKLLEIYKDNNMTKEYKTLLEEIYYNYDKYDLKIYKKLKELYNSSEWKRERDKILEKIKKEEYVNEILCDIYVEEEMYDNLFEIVNNYNMSFVIGYEKYLLPKYNKELLSIYYNSCLREAESANNRKKYANLAHSINHMINMEDSDKIVKKLVSEIKELYFRNRTAMEDEFQNNLINYKYYINNNCREKTLMY